MTKVMWFSAMVAVMVLCAGCQSTGKTLATTARTVDATMVGWMHWVKNGYATLEQEHKVAKAYERYQGAMLVAKTAYAEVALGKSKDDAKLDILVNTLRETQDDLLNLVDLFKKGAVAK